MMVRVFSLTCLNCKKVWFSTTRHESCAFCGSKAVADTGPATA